jgi:glutathione peroxidase
MDGSVVSLSTYKGKVILVVNLARNSTFSDQLSSLDKIYQAYKDKGLVVIGVPSNDFGAEEPGTDTDVRKAYADAHPAFPVVARVSIRGKDQVPLFGYLTSAKDKSLGGDVHWNFTKFIIDRNGQVVARFASDVDPEAPQFRLTLEKVLAGTFKKADKANEDEDSKKAGDDADEDSER